MCGAVLAGLRSERERVVASRVPNSRCGRMDVRRDASFRIAVDRHGVRFCGTLHRKPRRGGVYRVATIRLQASNLVGQVVQMRSWTCFAILPLLAVSVEVRELVHR